jgi:hypothetical protein
VAGRLGALYAVLDDARIEVVGRLRFIYARARGKQNTQKTEQL